MQQGADALRDHCKHCPLTYSPFPFLAFCRTILVLRDFATKLVATERSQIEAEEAKELAELDAQLKQ